MMASKHLRTTGRRLFRGVDAAMHSSALQPSLLLLNSLESAVPGPQTESSWRTRSRHSWELPAGPRGCEPSTKAPMTTSPWGSGEPTPRCRGLCAVPEEAVASQRTGRDFVLPAHQRAGNDGLTAARGRDGLLPARRQLSARASGDPTSEPRLAENDPRNVPDRPAPPEARRIVEPGQDPSAAAGGEGKEGYVSLMQQIVGAVRERPVDAAAQSRLEALKSRMEEDEAKRGFTKGTVTYAQLAQILSDAKQQRVASREFLEGVAKKYDVDVALLGDVLDTVSIATEKPLRDGGKLLGLE